MFEKVEVPVLGIVENMVCIFAATAVITSQSSAPVARRNWLSSITPNCWDRCRCIFLCVKTDRGTPTVISRPDSEFTAIYRDLAGRVAAQLYWQGEVIPGEIAFRAV